jgi:hypothetical protein
VEDKDINSFCWNLRDELDAYISSSFNPSQNLSFFPCLPAGMGQYFDGAEPRAFM